MLRTHFYFGTIKKYVITFGTLFNEIFVSREDKDNNQTSLMRVPLSYAPKDKMLARVNSDPNIDRPTATFLPRMSFQIMNVQYDNERKKNTLNKYSWQSEDKTKRKYMFEPVPYNFQIRLYIYVKNAEDGTKIVEQILPFFTPDWTPTVHLIPEMDITLDIPVIIGAINSEDTYDQQYQNRRAIVWTIDFTLKGWLFAPVKEKKIIKFANTTFYISKEDDLLNAIGNTAPSDRVTVRPALLPNGQPTSNAAASVPLSQIEADDDFGYAVDIELILEK